MSISARTFENAEANSKDEPGRFAPGGRFDLFYRFLDQVEKATPGHATYKGRCSSVDRMPKPAPGAWHQA